jgi:hypothetical protein
VYDKSLHVSAIASPLSALPPLFPTLSLFPFSSPYSSSIRCDCISTNIHPLFSYSLVFAMAQFRHLQHKNCRKISIEIGQHSQRGESESILDIYR